jgi:hypothetical protein
MQAEARGAVSKGVDMLARIETHMNKEPQPTQTATVAPQLGPNIIGEANAEPAQTEIVGPASVEGSTFIVSAPVASFAGVTGGDKPPAMDAPTKEQLEAIAREIEEEEKMRKARGTMIVDDGPPVEAPKKEELKAKKPPDRPQCPRSCGRRYGRNRAGEIKICDQPEGHRPEGQAFRNVLQGMGRALP